MTDVVVVTRQTVDVVKARQTDVVAVVRDRVHHVRDARRGPQGVPGPTGATNGSIVVDSYMTGPADMTTDATEAIRAAAATGSGVMKFGRGIYRYTDRILFAQSLRGGWILEGEGAGFKNWPLPTNEGTILVWDGDDATLSTMEFGDPDHPLFVAGDSQPASWPFGQFNVRLKNISIVMNKGCKSVAYVHDQDGFQIDSVYVDGRSRNDVRGIFDFRGCSNNMTIKQLTVGNLPNGYGLRAGDGASNWAAHEVFMEGVALPYWIGDVEVAEDPYATGNITIADSTFEGLTGDGKFVVSTLGAVVAAGATEIVVADGSLFDAGDPIYIGRGYNNFEMNRVDTAVGNTITLGYPLEFAHAGGEPVKAGRIGVHIGANSARFTRTQAITIRRPMFDRTGCCIDAHDTQGLTIEEPQFTSRLQRGLYLDGQVQNVILRNPTVVPGQLATWRLFEITDRGGVFNFLWLVGADRSGLAQPYINAQGDIGGQYIGDFTQTEGVSGLPAYFRALQMTAQDGIVLQESDGAIGLKYRTGVFGEEVDNFTVSPGGDIDNAGGVTSGGTISSGGDLTAAGDATITGLIKSTASAVESRFGAIWTTPDGTKRYSIYIDNAGVISSTLLP